MRIHKRGPRPSELPTLDARPHHDEQIQICCDAWHDLATERALGFSSLGSIPFRAITHWAELHLLNREATLLLVAVIRRLDADRHEREASKRDLKGA